jgi:predicted permease
MRVRELFHRHQLDKDLDDEIQAHIDMAIRDRIEGGEDPAVAEAGARREFGNRTQVKETSRDILGWNTVERVLQDLRYGVRGLRRNPGFTTVAIGSLALGIGANTAIFSLMNAVMFHLLPVQDPGRLVELLQKYPGEPRGNGYWTWKDYEHFKAHNTVFSDIIGTSFDNILRVQSEDGSPQHAVGEFVTSNYFKDLGVRPAMGRIIDGGDDAASQDVAVVSWNFWRKFLGGNPRVIGERIFVRNKPVTIVGVAPLRFVGPRVENATDLWLPLKPQQGTLGLLARLKPGATIDQARAEMRVLYRFTIDERFARSGDPLVHKLKVEVEPAGSGLNTVRDRFGQPLFILMAIVGLLLVITCVNLAGLLLARGAARDREFAVRAGLGASRTRLITQVLTESLLLSISGACCGIFLAYVATSTVVHLLTTGRIGEQVYLRVEPDLHIVLFSAGVGILTGVFFGMAPALHAVRSMPGSVLRQTGATETRSKRFLGAGLVIAQIGLSVLLLSTGALFIVHLWKLKHEYLGFQRDGVLLLTLDSSSGAYSRQRLAASYEDILTRLEAIPGVLSVALAGPTPLSGAGASGFVKVQGLAESPADRRWIAISYTSPSYFQTLGSPILAGRDFRRQDQLHPRVAIINQTFARHYFSHRDPVGKAITLYHVTLDPRRLTK